MYTLSERRGPGELRNHAKEAGHHLQCDVLVYDTKRLATVFLVENGATTHVIVSTQPATTLWSRHTGRIVGDQRQVALDERALVREEHAVILQRERQHATLDHGANVEPTASRWEETRALAFTH